MLVGDRGDYVCRADVAEVSVPATLQAAIAARIDRLEPTAKRMPQRRVRDRVAIRHRLADRVGGRAGPRRAVKAELIDQVSVGPRAEYAFHHPLIRAVAYESQLKSDRAELHRRLASVIQVRDPTSVDENAALIAEHVQAAGDVPGAYGWHMRAASWLSKQDLAGACQSWERARECADVVTNGLLTSHRHAHRATSDVVCQRYPR